MMWSSAPAMNRSGGRGARKSIFATAVVGALPTRRDSGTTCASEAAPLLRRGGVVARPGRREHRVAARLVARDPALPAGRRHEHAVDEDDGAGLVRGPRRVPLDHGSLRARLPPMGTAPDGETDQ